MVNGGPKPVKLDPVMIFMAAGWSHMDMLFLMGSDDCYNDQPMNLSNT